MNGLVISTTDVVKLEDVLAWFEELHKNVTGDIGYADNDVWHRARTQLLMQKPVKIYVAEAKAPYLI